MIVLPDGTKIFLPEYEAALGNTLGTQELAVTLDEKNRLTLVLGKNEGGDPKAVLEKLRPVLEQRPRGQQINRVIFDPQPLPRTVTGKLKRWEIKTD